MLKVGAQIHVQVTSSRWWLLWMINLCICSGSSCFPTWRSQQLKKTTLYFQSRAELIPRALFTASVGESRGHMGLKIKSYSKKLASSWEQICVSRSRGAVSSSSFTRRRCCPGCPSSKGRDRFPILPVTATTFWKSTHCLSLLVLPWKSPAGFSSRVPGAGQYTRDSLCTNMHQK